MCLRRLPFKYLCGDRLEVAQGKGLLFFTLVGLQHAKPEANEAEAIAAQRNPQSEITLWLTTYLPFFLCCPCRTGHCWVQLPSRSIYCPLQKRCKVTIRPKHSIANVWLNCELTNDMECHIFMLPVSVV